VPLFIGVTSLNSREVARKARFAREVGAEGIFTGVPFYYPPTVDNAIQFYHDLADYLPDLSIQIYHNPPLHNIHIPVSAFPRLVEKRQIVSMKDSHRSPLEFIRLNDVVAGKISVFVNQMQAFPFQSLGAVGFWSTDVNMGPWPLLRLRDAVADGDDETAKQILREIGGLGEGEWGGPQDNARKIAATAAGYADLGPNRPPFVVIKPESLDKQMRRAAGWKALCEKYRPQVESRTLAAAGAR
jgi:hydratase-aldolase